MLEKFGFTTLAIAAIAYIVFLVIVSILAFPFGLIGLLVLTGVGALFLQVVLDRVNNTEDDYYSKNVDL